jgi:hypothetical protein
MLDGKIYDDKLYTLSDIGALLGISYCNVTNWIDKACVLPVNGCHKPAKYKGSDVRRVKEARERSKQPKPAPAKTKPPGNPAGNKVVHCHGCIYYRKISFAPVGNKTNGKQGYACHFCIDTNTLRGIPAAECYKHKGTPYTPKKKGGKVERWTYYNG